MQQWPDQIKLDRKNTLQSTRDGSAMIIYWNIALAVPTSW